MSTLNLSLTTKKKKSKGSENVVVEFSADQFERFAAALGLFRDEFLNSLKKAEKECDHGKVHRFEDVIS